MCPQEDPPIDADRRGHGHLVDDTLAEDFQFFEVVFDLGRGLRRPGEHARLPVLTRHDDPAVDDHG